MMCEHFVAGECFEMAIVSPGIRDASEPKGETIGAPILQIFGCRSIGLKILGIVMMIRIRSEPSLSNGFNDDGPSLEVGKYWTWLVDLAEM